MVVAARPPAAKRAPIPIRQTNLKSRPGPAADDGNAKNGGGGGAEPAVAGEGGGGGGGSVGVILILSGQSIGGTVSPTPTP